MLIFFLRKFYIYIYIFFKEKKGNFIRENKGRKRKSEEEKLRKNQSNRETGGQIKEKVVGRFNNEDSPCQEIVIYRVGMSLPIRHRFTFLRNFENIIYQPKVVLTFFGKAISTTKAAVLPFHFPFL